MTFDFSQLCQRPDGSIYGIASGKLCKKGRPINFLPLKKAVEVAKKKGR